MAEGSTSVIGLDGLVFSGDGVGCGPNEEVPKIKKGKEKVIEDFIISGDTANKYVQGENQGPFSEVNKVEWLGRNNGATIALKYPNANEEMRLGCNIDAKDGEKESYDEENLDD